MTLTAPAAPDQPARPKARPLWRKVLRWLGFPPPLERWLRRHLPRRLFPRSLLIIVMPMLLLQSVVAFVFLYRHWEGMTVRLSDATASELATLADLIERLPADEHEAILAVASDRLFHEVELFPDATLPGPEPKAFFSLLDRTLSRRIAQHVERPFWIDTIGSSRFVEVRVKTDAGILRVITRRSSTYATNAHITLVWMAGTSLVLIAVALIILRGQVRPIQELAAVAERFGRGRTIGEFRPHGALEVRQAGWAFLEMRARIERQMDQRTAMLAGVSHDLRTMLTRFRLELALGEEADHKAMNSDVDEMQAILEDYLTFARADGDEASDNVNVTELIQDVTVPYGAAWTAPKHLTATLRPAATRRMLRNLVDNAAAHADHVDVRAAADEHWLTLTVADAGPGIAPVAREAVFNPFHRLDNARNRDRGGTGLGLTIARDIARKHGGDVSLSTASLGGLRATVRLPR